MNYIAIYYLLTSVSGGDLLELFDKKTFPAENDIAAIEKAKGIKNMLEATENAISKNSKAKRIVILQSIRNQYNKRTVYLRGYGH